MDAFASDLEFKQAQSLMDAARADVARFRGLVAMDRNALDLLSGTVFQRTCSRRDSMGPAN